MKTAAAIAFTAMLLNAGCAAEPRRAAKSQTQPVGAVRTAEQANDVVRRHIRKAGGDPEKSELTAEWRRGAWHVMAWHIRFPNNTGASRFVPGGHTFYIVSPDGRVTDTLPGT